MGGSNRKCELAGWFLFIASSLFFMISSVRDRDVVGFVGGLLFFLACIVFLYATLARHGKPR